MVLWVDDPMLYEWCSARWFKENANKEFHLKVMGFNSDRVNVFDDF